MAEKEERVSSSTIKKRKYSEGSDTRSLFSSTEFVTTGPSSSRSPAVDPQVETEAEPEQSLASVSQNILLCTSNWTCNILKALPILPVLTEIYTPMQLLSFAFDDINNPVSKETIELCKNIILQSRTPFHDLDFDDIEKADACTCFRFLLDRNLNNQWTRPVDMWDISPKTCADKLDKLQTRVCKKFQIHGELFAQQLMHMNMAKKKGSLTEPMYQKLFEEFIGLFGITTISEPCITECTIQIGNDLVKSKPNIIFPDLVNTNENQEDMTVIALCEVKAGFSNPSNDSSEKVQDETLITHLPDGLIGQHGGELLTHLPFSSRNNGILGLIVQKTFVTFAYFRCDQVQFERIKNRENDFASKPVIFYSKPYNYLTASDRNQLIEPLLRLGFQQYSRYK